MQYFSVIASLTLGVLTHLTNASPIVQTRQDAVPAQFLLQTQVYDSSNDHGTNKDGLYVISYHTGAGQGVAAAETAVPTSWFYFNDTTLQFSYPNNEIGPWPVDIEYGAYQSFEEITISIAGGRATPGFFVNGTGLQQNNTAGWLACDWWLGSPMIFAFNNFYSYPTPASCSRVNLIPKALA